MRAVLSNANFRRLWVSQVILTLGGSVMQMGFIEMFRTHGFNVQAETAKFSFAVSLPGLLLGPVAMVYLDRWQRRSVMLLSDALRTVLAVLIALWLLPLLTGRVAERGLFPVYWLIGVIGMIATFYLPARAALVPNLVPAEHLIQANTLFTTSLSIALVGGAAVGGFIAERFGVSAAILSSGLSFLVSFGLLWLIRMPAHATTQPKKNEFWDGCVYLWEHPTALPLVLLNGLFAFMLGILMVVFVGYAIKTLGLRTAGVGYLVAVAGVGAAAGIGLVGHGKSWTHSDWLPFVQLLLAAASLVGLGLTTNVWLAALVVVVLGAVSATVMICIDAKLQAQVEDSRRGAVFAARGMLTSATMIVAFWLQFGAEWFMRTPPPAVLFWLGIGSLVASVLMLLGVRRKRA
jgi:MFS family permease